MPDAKRLRDELDAEVQARKIARPCDDVELFVKLERFRAFLRSTKLPAAEEHKKARKQVGMLGKQEEHKKARKQVGIVCELNPTSNHMLLGDTFDGTSNRNRRSLAVFFEEDLPVVLCTDDDGVWAIHKCKRHYRHVSVGHEYCQAIMRRDITTKGQLTLLLEYARDLAFASEKKEGPVVTEFPN